MPHSNPQDFLKFRFIPLVKAAYPLVYLCAMNMIMDDSSNHFFYIYFRPLNFQTSICLFNEGSIHFSATVISPLCNCEQTDFVLYRHCWSQFLAFTVSIEIFFVPYTNLKLFCPMQHVILILSCGCSHSTLLQAPTMSTLKLLKWMLCICLSPKCKAYT